MAVSPQLITGVCLLSLLVDATAGEDAQGSCPNKKNITFAYITAKSGVLVTSGAKAAVDLALEEINSRNDILPNYTLSYSTIRDSECKGEAAVEAFVQEFAVPYLTGNNTTHLSMLCCGCSPATVPVARISHYWNIPHVAFAAATDVLNDHQTYKSFFRTIPQYTYLPQAIIETVQMYNWTKLFVITQDDPLFVKITDNLQSLLNTRLSTPTMFINFPVRSLPSNIPHIIQHVRNSSVTFINAYPSIACPILCEAAKSNLTSPVHNWITHSWYPINWWNCSNCNEIQKILNGSLALAPSGFFPLQNDSSDTMSNLTSSCFRKLYNKNVERENLTNLEASGMAYDAIWAIALGLHTASMRLKAGDDSGCKDHPGTLKQSLEEFDYSNQKMGCVLQTSIAKVNFTGITGQIKFNKDGSREASGNLVMHRYQLTGNDFKKVPIATIHVSAQNITTISYVTSLNDVHNTPCTARNASSDCSPGGSMATANPGMATFLITLLTTLVCIFKPTI